VTAEDKGPAHPPQCLGRLSPDATTTFSVYSPVQILAKAFNLSIKSALAQLNVYPVKFRTI
jgi:hypothetical protein